ncbi:MAG: dialkylresorcinol condensing enzyme [Campylobacteraceae bacterium]|jgi:hypothetical protein|nr:dialkylresorcinol condensing enzyme [Campylobacteraceae bacterium]
MPHHKKVLVVHYSQSGQLDDAIRYCILPLLNDKSVSVTDLRLKPSKPFPFPWNVLDFLSVFPESVYCDKISLEPFDINKNEEFDLIILAYQVWFLSPSLPMSSFLQSAEAKTWLNDKPVITFIACRNMWLTAQEKMKRLIAQNGGVLCDNIALIDGGNSLETFITTPRWLLTGKKDKFWFFSSAGVKKSDMENSARFGRAISGALKNDIEKSKRPLLKGLGAVNVNEKLIMSEKIGHRSFLIWGKLLKKIGKPKSRIRRVFICIYLLFLVLMIITVVPLTLLLRALFYPLIIKKLKKQKAYYEEPSGSENFKENNE